MRSLKYLFVGPDLTGAEGGIARISRLYVRALQADCGAGEALGYLILHDTAPPGGEGVAGGASSPAEGHVCGHSKARFLLKALQLVPRAEVVVCAHLHLLPVLILAGAGGPRRRFFLVAHGVEVWRPYTALERWAMRRVERILCVSEYSRRQILRFFPGLESGSLVVLANGLDPEMESRERAAAGDGGRHPRILSVARLTSADRFKGIDTLIESLPEILRRHPDATLQIIGAGDDRDRLERLAGLLGVSGRVAFEGQVSDEFLREAYDRCDVFALPSRKEGFGLVFLEAMSRGRPCIAARAGGASEVVNDRVGAMVEYGHSEQIATAVSDLMRNPPEPALIEEHLARFRYGSFQRNLRTILRGVSPVSK